MEALPHDVLYHCVEYLNSLINIIRFGLVCQLFYEIAKQSMKAFFNPDGTLREYKPYLRLLSSRRNGSKYRQLLISNFRRMKQADNAPLNCAVEFVVEFLETGKIWGSQSLCYWQNSLGPMLAHIYSKVKLADATKIEDENLADSSYDGLFGSRKIIMFSLQYILQNPVSISLPRFKKILRHHRRETLIEVCTATNFSDCSSDQIEVLGRYGNEESVLLAMTQINPSRQLELILAALQNVSFTIQGQIDLLENYMTQTRVEYWNHKMFVFALARSKQPTELYEFLYQKRKETTTDFELENERALMLDLPDEEVCSLITKKIDWRFYGGHLLALAITKNRSSKLFKALNTAMDRPVFPAYYCTRRMEDPDIFFTFSLVDEFEISHLLYMFTPQAQAEILRRGVALKRFSISKLGSMFLSHRYYGRNCTILQIIVEETIKAGRYLPFEIYEDPTHLLILVLRQLNIHELSELRRIVGNGGNNKNPLSGLIYDPDGRNVLFKALQAVTKRE